MEEQQHGQGEVPVVPPAPTPAPDTTPPGGDQSQQEQQPLEPPQGETAQDTVFHRPDEAKQENVRPLHGDEEPPEVDINPDATDQHDPLMSEDETDPSLPDESYVADPDDEHGADDHPPGSGEASV